MKESTVILIIVAVIFAVVALAVMKGSSRIVEMSKDCEARGGVQVKTYEGFACIEAKRI